MNKTSTLAALVLCLAPSLGSAGLFLNAPVSIDVKGATARGSLTNARISTNSIEYMNCYVTTYSRTSTFTTSGHCTARDAAGVFAQCTTTEPELIKAIQSITPASDVRFGWDTGLLCTQIFVRNASFNLE